MSSGSSEVDVIRTRIPAYDDDNTVLYAYEPKPSYFINHLFCPPLLHSGWEQRRTPSAGRPYPVTLPQPQGAPARLTYQVINDAIQKLDKKLDAIYGKVSKIYRCRLKSFWQNRKLHGHGYKNRNYLPSRKQKYQRMRKREQAHSSFSYPESYSPTIPVRRRGSGSQSNLPTTPCNSDDSPEPEHDSLLEEQDRDAGLTRSPSLTSSSFQPYYPDDDGQDNDQVKYDLSCFLSIEVASSPVERNPGVLKQSCPEDPSTWSVDEVILFLKQTDPQALGPISDLFRHHEIDGKALLLLNSDMMLKYMGLKLGTAVKLCHYIERLKEEKYYKKQRYYNN
ncbi:sex comb on midleg-like protein 1 [Eulemur rufifrons]|uniref:sex comb on midleg-like protein 1 n=1 Tax=Eulemur rufifrons TaxID=859984 RepID=UPI0037425852